MTENFFITSQTI